MGIGTWPSLTKVDINVFLSDFKVPKVSTPAAFRSDVNRREIEVASIKGTSRGESIEDI